MPVEESTLLSEYLGIRKAGDAVGVSARTVRRAVISRKLPGFRPNGGRGMILVKRRDLFQWVERSRI
jgi:excisionase family DNA binding protein